MLALFTFASMWPTFLCHERSKYYCSHVALLIYDSKEVNIIALTLPYWYMPQKEEIFLLPCNFTYLCHKRSNDCTYSGHSTTWA